MHAVDVDVTGSGVLRRRRALGGRRIRRAIGIALVYLAIGAILFLILFPIAWMISTSFKSNQTIFNMPPEWIPLAPTLQGYFTLFSAQSQFLTYFRNSLIVVSLTVLTSLTFATLAGYSFSRFRFKWSNGMMLLLLATQMFPGVILLISGYIMLKELRLLNNYFGLVLAYTSFSLPFCVWMLKGFFDTIPRDIEEAAYIDGCGRLRALVSVILPLSIPGLMGTGLFSFVLAWEEFMFALTIMSRNEMRTLPPGFVLTYVGEFQYRWADMMAAALVISIPVIIVYVFLQRYLIQGLTAGAVKG